MFKSLRPLLLATALLATPLSAFAGVFVSINIAPPALPVYAQPVIPGPGYIWTPGYWAWNDDEGDYFWVPGTWVLAPQPGFLWTPGWWGWGNGFYIWHGGYWGPHVGFYGGIDYGYGYTGEGYHGGYWNRGEFRYNRSVNNINTTIIHNTYNTRVVNNVTVNRISYNGGKGGNRAQPSAEDSRAQHERHLEATSNQAQHEQAAHADHGQLASVNHGRPAVFATPKPGALHEEGAVSRGQVAPFKGNANHAESGDIAPRHAAAPVYQQQNRRPEESRAEPALSAHQQPQQGRVNEPQYRQQQRRANEPQYRQPQNHEVSPRGDAATSAPQLERERPQPPARTLDNRTFEARPPRQPEQTEQSRGRSLHEEQPLPQRVEPARPQQPMQQYHQPQAEAQSSHRESPQPRAQEEPRGRAEQSHERQLHPER